MVVAALYFLALPLSVFLLLWLFRVRSKKYLIGVPAVVLCLPMILGVGTFLLRSPIQQGKFLPEFGPLLSMFFPADDLYSPLAEEPLSPDKSTYKFNLSHKYVGNHAVYIEVPSYNRTKIEVERGLNVTVDINDRGKTLLSKSEESGSPYLGKSRYGYYYVGYKVPRDVPVADEVTVEVNIGNDIGQFLERHNKAKLIVRKSSDQ